MCVPGEASIAAGSLCILAAELFISLFYCSNPVSRFARASKRSIVTVCYAIAGGLIGLTIGSVFNDQDRFTNKTGLACMVSVAKGLNAVSTAAAVLEADIQVQMK